MIRFTPHSCQIAAVVAMTLAASSLFATDPAPKPATPAPKAAHRAKAAPKPAAPLPKHIPNLPVMLEADGKLRFDFTEEKVVLDGGLQPFMLGMKSGTLLVQAQLPKNPYPSKRITFPRMLGTVVSRDGGSKWTPIPLKPGDNGVNIEGGIVQLRDGTILALDTYITPSGLGEAVGQLYTSHDEWRKVQGPKEVRFHMPGAIYPSKDDGGRPHEAMRLHRRIIELPNGDLITTVYGWLEGDAAPSTYEPRMIRSRTMLLRSTDRGLNWNLISTVAVGPRIGTESFGEPVLVRLSKGPHPGRLLCYLRTGRELYECYSDDEGKTWSPAKPRVFAGFDVNRTELWVDMFRSIRGKKDVPLDENNQDELRGSVVDPDVIELRSGLLVLAFGVRIPQQACWKDPRHPWNGNYLAISRDHGETWSNVIRMTSGVLTSHYMTVEETSQDNRIFVVYDLRESGTKSRRDTWGRFVTITEKPAR